MIARVSFEEVVAMETKSSLRRICWSLVYVILALIGLRVATGVESSQSPAFPQRDRTVTRKPWSVEPVRVVAAKNKKKAKIDIDKTFDDDDDWLDGFTITVSNGSDKTVTALIAEMIFRREPGDTRPPVAQTLHFGPLPMSPKYTLRDPNKVIKVGETADLKLSAVNYKSLRSLLDLEGYPSSINRVELVIRQVGFEDGSVLVGGTLYLGSKQSRRPDEEDSSALRRCRNGNEIVVEKNLLVVGLRDSRPNRIAHGNWRGIVGGTGLSSAGPYCE